MNCKQSKLELATETFANFTQKSCEKNTNLLKNHTCHLIEKILTEMINTQIQAKQKMKVSRF